MAWAGRAGGAQVSPQCPHAPSLAFSCLDPRSVSQGTGHCPGRAAGPLPSPVLCRQKCSSGPAPPEEAGRDGQGEPWDPPLPDEPPEETVPHLCHSRVLWPRLPRGDCGVPRAQGRLWAAFLILSTILGRPSACRATQGALQGEQGDKVGGARGCRLAPTSGDPQNSTRGLDWPLTGSVFSLFFCS